jgi:uncharacterized protein YhbP (UPF0306 family)
MDEKIINFISKQTCANVCCVDEKGHPYCYTCFYSFESEEMLLHYKSSNETHHSVLLLRNPNVAGTILPDAFSILQIKGIQFEGMILPFDHSHTKNAISHFHKKHPIALAMPGEIWTIKLNSVKLTDNTLGFGKKLIWQREESEHHHAH